MFTESLLLTLLICLFLLAIAGTGFFCYQLAHLEKQLDAQHELLRLAIQEHRHLARIVQAYQKQLS